MAVAAVAVVKVAAVEAVELVAVVAVAGVSVGVVARAVASAIKKSDRRGVAQIVR
ncbi:hypothetical protein ACIBI7_16070 [Nonomuraea fuscirosea]|uniref:hypothetical protein n=1 Tax=Nonomuraea fuscirosea TaxID=1291556 RepID=UPI0037B8686F